jgi:hypothetical protein
VRIVADFLKGREPEKRKTQAEKVKMSKNALFHHTPQNVMPLDSKSQKPDTYATKQHFGSRDSFNSEILWKAI